MHYMVLMIDLTTKEQINRLEDITIETIENKTMRENNFKREGREGGREGRRKREALGYCGVTSGCLTHV